MTSLESAISMLQAEVDSFVQGTRAQPTEGTPEWFLLRGKAAGLSMLKRMAQAGVDSSPKLADRFYRNCAVDFKTLDAETVAQQVALTEVDLAASTISPAEVAAPK